MGGPPSRKKSSGANVVLVAITSVFALGALLSVGSLIVPMDLLLRPKRMLEDRREPPEDLGPAAPTVRGRVDEDGVRYVWRDVKLGRQLTDRLSKVPESRRRWIGVVRADWEPKGGMYFTDLSAAQASSEFVGYWRETDELHAVMMAADAGEGHAFFAAFWATEILNVDSESERTKRSKELKRLFEEEVRPNLLDQRALDYTGGLRRKKPDEAAPE